MTDFNKEDYIRYRLEKADETLKAVKVLSQNKLWNSMVNRLYYTCFYAVSALLFQNGISAKSHSGVKTQFFLAFIKTGRVPKEMGKLYSDLFDGRQKGDYSDFYDFEEETVTVLHEKSIAFVEFIRKLLG